MTDKNYFSEYLFYSHYINSRDDEFYKLIKRAGLKKLYKSDKKEFYKRMCKLINVESIDNDRKINLLMNKLKYLSNIGKL